MAFEISREQLKAIAYATKLQFEISEVNRELVGHFVEKTLMSLEIL